MALDQETINNTYFKGYGDTTPRGQTGVPGFYVPFDEWPQEVKDAYSYNPEGAAKLLDQAGYPRGSDGIRFKTTVTFGPRQDVGYIESAVAYWSEIGVDVRLDLWPSPAYSTFATDPEREQGLLESSFGAMADASDLLRRFTPGYEKNPCKCDDPAYNALFERAKAATTFEEQKKPLVEMDMYSIKSV